MKIQDTMEIKKVDETTNQQLFAIIYFGERGFEPFASNIKDQKLMLLLQTYPTLLGMMQNQRPEGLAATKISNNMFLMAYVLNLKNPLAKDIRLKKNTTTVINFIVPKADYLKLMYYFEEFEQYLQDYFAPIVFLEDLYAIDFSQIIPIFLSSRANFNDNRVVEIEEKSLATEFKRWLKEVEIENKELGD